MTDAVDKPPAPLSVKKSAVSELTKQVAGDKGLEAVKDITFGSVSFFFFQKLIYTRSFAEFKTTTRSPA